MYLAVGAAEAGDKGEIIAANSISPSESDTIAIKRLELCRSLTIQKRFEAKKGYRLFTKTHNSRLLPTLANSDFIRKKYLKVEVDAGELQRSFSVYYCVFVFCLKGLENLEVLKGEADYG